MPIYEYRCTNCGLNFEKLRSMSEVDKDTLCPACQSKAERIPSKFACFSTSETGTSTTVGGNSCSSCAGGSCSTCGL
jgi:putative FmdB family regulatory protein